MGKKFTQNLILLAITILIFISLLEISARIIVYFHPNLICNTFSSLDDYYLCNLESSLSKNPDAYNKANFQFDRTICDKWDSELGWVPNPNCRSVRNSVEYSTNSAGFRGTKEFALQKNKTRIIIVGDSFTWGENNFDNETYPFYFQQMLGGNADVINMGVHGYGPDQFYLYFTRDGIKYKPDVVVVGLFLPDIHRTILKVGSYFKPRYLIENNELKLDKSSLKIPDLKTALLMSRDVKKKPMFYSLSYLYGMYSKFMRLITSYRDEEKLTFKIIENMNEKLRKENIKMIVVLIPEQGMVEKGNADYHGVMPKLIGDLEKDNIDYINLQPVFKKETDSSGQSLYNGHTNTRGNRVIARELYNYLIKNNFVNIAK